jgi:hypothetical protein
VEVVRVPGGQERLDRAALHDAEPVADPQSMDDLRLGFVLMARRRSAEERANAGCKRFGGRHGGRR